MADIQRPIFVVPEPLSNIAAGNGLAERPASHLGLHNYVGMVWRTPDNANLWVRGQIPAGVSVGFVSLLRCTAQPGTTIRVRLGTSQAQVDGTAPYDSGALPLISPSITRIDGLYHSHLELPTPGTYSWWRIDIGGHSGAFEASSLVIGTLMRMERFYERAFEYGIRDLGAATFNPNGVIDTPPGRVLRTVKFTLPSLTEVEWEGLVRPLIERRGQNKPVYICFDPEPTTYRHSRTFFGMFANSPFAASGVKARTYGVPFELVSMI